MSKLALIIGVSTYASGFSPLPSAIRDGEAMRATLQSPEIGKFDDVVLITDPDPLQMQEAIERTFSGRKKDDLIVLFFSGHGVKDNNGKLYLATALTKKTDRGDLVKSTAVSASFIHDIMKDSRSKRKVIILDCCFSGAFAHGLSAKDDGTVDLKSQLGGEGCAVLTSSSSVQYSFEQQGEELSVYTRYLVEGMQTGAADLGSDGYISVDELHEYAQSKVHEESPSMNPKIYALEEGYKIQLLEAVAPDPLLKYQRAVEQCAVAGEISPVWRITLDEMRAKLQLSADEADLVETRVLRPYREYRKKLQRYESAFKTAIQQGLPVKESIRTALKQLQRTLALRNEDILVIEERWEKWAESKRVRSSAVPKKQKVPQLVASSTPAAGTPLPKSVQSVPPNQIPENQIKSQLISTDMSSTNTSSTKNTNKLWIGAGIAAMFALATGAGVFAWATNRSPLPPQERTLAEIMFESPELIVTEECERLKDAYETGEDRVVKALETNYSAGQKCSDLGIAIAVAKPRERSIAELIASPDLLSSEDCQRLKDAYEQGDDAAVNQLRNNPNNTLVGQKCIALGAEISIHTTVEPVPQPDPAPQPDPTPQPDPAPQPNPASKDICIAGNDILRLFHEPGGARSEIRVTPGERLSVLSEEPVLASFGSSSIPYIQVGKSTGTGWIPKELTQSCS
ncbi:MAG: caspase family protein [Elainellaceae cyanobacterium]